MKKLVKSLLLGLLVMVVIPGVVSAHTITFYADGEVFATTTVEDGGDLYVGDYVPTKAGWTFDQWCTDPEFGYGSGQWAASNHGNWYWGVSSDMTFYAYYYSRAYGFVYNATTNEEDDYAGVIIYSDDLDEEYNIDANNSVYKYIGAFDNSDGGEEPYYLRAIAHPGYRFVEWRLGYQTAYAQSGEESNDYEGEAFADTTRVSTNVDYTLNYSASGWPTLYAVFELDPESDVQYIDKMYVTIPTPVVGEAPSLEVVSAEPEKYSVDGTGTCPWYDQTDKVCLNSKTSNMDDYFTKFTDGHAYSRSFDWEIMPGYRIDANTKMYINGVEQENRGYYQYSFAPEVVTHIVTYDYNGGLWNGLGVETDEVNDGAKLTAKKETMLGTMVVPSGKELDYFLVNGQRVEIGSAITFTSDTTIKYMWKDVYKPNPNLNGFKVETGTTTSIKLAWNKCDTATSYVVYQSTDNKKWTKLTTTSALNYTKTKLTVNKKYYYKVEAYKGSTKLVTSKVITTKTAPKAVTLKAKAKAYNSVKLTLGKTTGAKKFIIEKSTDNKTFTTAKTETKVGTKTVSGLEPGTKYYFRVKACNEYNVCSVSKVVNNTPALKKPTIKVSAKKGQITVKVPAVAGATGYEIQRSLKKGSGYTTIADVKSAKSYADKNGLVAKKKYYYRVRAYRIVNGKKVYSAFSKVTNTKAK